MKILIIGGTGAMGDPLSDILSREESNDVFVMVRHPNETDRKNLHYIQGNALDFGTFVRTVSPGFDVIIDFMVWSPKKLKQRLDAIFACCDQYIGMGSSAVYTNTHGLITEKTPRLFDKYKPGVKKQTYRYHIKKSVDENLIMKYPQRRWTIVRPSLTFNDRKLTFLGYRKEIWLWRYLHDQTIVIPEDVLDKSTTITYGGDAARAIAGLVGNPNALGQVVNVASDKSVKQGDILRTIQDTLKERCGKDLKILYIPDSKTIWKEFPEQYDIYEKDRRLNRCFSTEKLERICGDKIEFGDSLQQFSVCLSDLLGNEDLISSIQPVPDFNGWMDRMTGENMSKTVYSDKKSRKKYDIYKSKYLSKLYRMSRQRKTGQYKFVSKKK